MISKDNISCFSDLVERQRASQQVALNEKKAQMAALHTEHLQSQANDYRTQMTRRQSAIEQIDAALQQVVRFGVSINTQNLFLSPY